MLIFSDVCIIMCVLFQEGGEEEEGGDTKVKEGGEEEDTSALYGSHGPKYGGGCDLLYSQFELHSAVAKKHQIVLLQVNPWNYFKMPVALYYTAGLSVPHCRDVQ